jgi:hypothetical protein
MAISFDTALIEKVLGSKTSEVSALRGTSQDLLEDFVIELNYLTGRQDLVGLEKLRAHKFIKGRDNDRGQKLFKSMLEVRLDTLKRSLRKSAANYLDREFQKMSGDDVEHLLCAEISWTLALAFDVVPDAAMAEIWYRRAHHLFDECGFKRRSAVAFFECVRCKTQLSPNENLMGEYQDAYRMAMMIDDRKMASLCLSRLAHDYQIAGAKLTALKCAQEAVRLVETSRSSLEFHKGVFARFSILLELDRQSEAQRDMNFLKKSEYAEIHASLKPLGIVIEGAAVADQPVEATEASVANLLSPDEERLVKLLTERPQDRFHLAEALYGSALDVETLENRLKNLLVRIKKKMPGSIEVIDGKYALVSGQTVIESSDAVVQA